MNSSRNYESIVCLKSPIAKFEELKFGLHKITGVYWYFLATTATQTECNQIKNAYNKKFNINHFQTQIKKTSITAANLAKLKTEFPDWFVNQPINASQQQEGGGEKEKETEKEKEVPESNNNPKYLSEIWLQSPFQYTSIPQKFTLINDRPPFYLSEEKLGTEPQWLVHNYNEKIEKAIFGVKKNQVKIYAANMQKIQKEYPMWITTPPISTTPELLNIGPAMDSFNKIKNLVIKPENITVKISHKRPRRNNSENTVKNLDFNNENTVGSYPKMNPDIQQNLVKFFASKKLATSNEQSIPQTSTTLSSDSEQSMQKSFNDEEFFNVLREIPGIVDSENAPIQPVAVPPANLESGSHAFARDDRLLSNLSLFSTNQLPSEDPSSPQNTADYLKLFENEFDQDAAIQELQRFLQEQRNQELEKAERPSKLQKRN